MAEPPTCQQRGAARVCSEQKPEECEQWEKSPAGQQPVCRTPATTGISDFSPNLGNHRTQEPPQQSRHLPEDAFTPRGAEKGFYQRTAKLKGGSRDGRAVNTSFLQHQQNPCCAPAPWPGTWALQDRSRAVAGGDANNHTASSQLPPYGRGVL